MAVELTKSTTSESSDPVFRPLDERVREAMERFYVPGVAVGVIHDGREYSAGFGITNIDHPLPVTPDTLFQIGSTTKTVVGTMTMRLVEAGAIDVDAPIRTYLPELRLSNDDVAARVTLRHLLTHTGGWVGDFFEEMGRGDDALTKIVSRMSDLPQVTPLGEIWSYNNAGFYLMGRVIEVVTGKPFETAARELVLDPLGMRMSFFFAEEVITYRVVAGHTIHDDEGPPRPRIEREWALPRAAHPAGGIISTVQDQLRYARFHLGDGTASDGTRLLSRESMRLMQTPIVPAANGAYLGLTWFVLDMGSTRIVRHGGATVGQMSAFVLVPARNFAITVLTNADRGGLVAGEVVSWALEHYVGLHEPPPEPFDATVEDLAPYLGRYTARLADLELVLEEGTMQLRMTPKGGFPRADSPPEPTPPPMRAVLCGLDRLLVLDGPLKSARGEFLRDAEGCIAWLRIGARVHARM